MTTKTIAKSYSSLLTQIKKTIESGRKQIELTKALTYWRIGENISKHLLNQDDRAGYGKNLYKNLSTRQLASEIKQTLKTQQTQQTQKNPYPKTAKSSPY